MLPPEISPRSRAFRAAAAPDAARATLSWLRSFVGAHPWFVAAIAYAGLTCVYFWPVVAAVRTGVPHDLGDPLLNAWITWWNGTAVPLSHDWWNAPAFWPIPGAMAFSEHLLGAMVFFSPLRWTGADPLTSYNVVFLLSWPLSAIAAHALCYELTRRHDAAFVGGLVYGFAPYRLDQVAHLQVLLSCWMPLALLALHKFQRAATARGQIAWSCAFGGAWLIQALTNGYFLVYFSVFVGLWVAWHRHRREDAGGTLRLASIWALFSVPLIPLLASYRTIHDRLVLGRGFGEIASFGADVVSFLTAPDLLLFWPLHLDHRPERALYPGIVAMGLAAVGVVFALRQSTTRADPVLARRVRRSAIGLGVVLVLLGLWTVTAGGWTVRVFSVVLLSDNRGRKPITLGILILACALATAPRVRAAWKHRSTFAFYLFGGIAAALFCMGPTGMVFGRWLIEKPPYFWLMKLPGGEALRVPTRFAMIGCLALAVSASFGLQHVRRRSGWRVSPGLILVLLILDCWPRAVPVHAAPQAFTLPGQARNAAVLEMPIGSVAGDVAAMYRGIFHGRPVVNGYSGHVPAAYRLLVQALHERDPSILTAVSRHGRLCVVLDAGRTDVHLSQTLAEQSGGSLVSAIPGRRFYLFPETAPVAPAAGRTVPITEVQDDGGGTCAPCAIDGVGETIWSSRDTQRAEHALRLTLSGPTTVTGVRLWLDGVTGDYPRRLAIHTSKDGANWSLRWTGLTAGLAYQAVIANQQHPVVSIALPPHTARFVLIRQLAASQSPAHWSAAGVEVLR